MKRYLSCMVGVLFLLGGCVTDPVRDDGPVERTPMENRVLGAYNALSDEVLLTASARGVDPLGNAGRPARQSRQQQDVLEAMRVMAFHADDVDAFKRLGWAGEGNDGLLAPFEMNRDNVPAGLREFASGYGQEQFDSVIAAVNGARELVMRRVVEDDDRLSDTDLPKVRRVFGELNAERALSGDKIQMADGTWTVK